MPITQTTREDVVTALKETYNTLTPGFDVQTEGTPEEDIFVKAPTFGAFGTIYDNLYDISLKQTLEFPESIDTEELNDLLNNNFGFARRSATKSTGEVSFYATDLVRYGRGQRLDW